MLLAQANRFLPPPRVVLNGPPKTGTHLLSDCCSLLPRMMFSGRHFALPDFFDRSAPVIDPASAYPSLDGVRLQRFLAPCPQGMFITAHARFHPEFQALLHKLQFKHVLLLRDPRDVVVSHVFFVKKMPLHPQHKHFTETLTSDADRIMETIRGFSDGPAGDDSFTSIPDVLAKFVPWLDDPSILVVRFEDLVGAHGGGDTQRQLARIQAIGEFVGRPLTHDQASQIAQKMYGKGSLTFRKGLSGDWRNHFTAAHRAAFRDVAGDLLVRFGYETDD